jgi:hypothetical protein
VNFAANRALPQPPNTRQCPGEFLSFAHCVFVDAVVAGDDERIGLGEREVREVTGTR